MKKNVEVEIIDGDFCSYPTEEGKKRTCRFLSPDFTRYEHYRCSLNSMIESDQFYVNHEGYILKPTFCPGKRK